MPQGLGVREHPRFGRSRDLDRTLQDGRLGRGEDRQLDHVDRLDGVWRVGPVQTRRREQASNHVVQPPSLPGDYVVHLIALGLHPRSTGYLHGGQNGCDRGLQLVRHQIQEVALHAVDLDQLGHVLPLGLV